MKQTNNAIKFLMAQYRAIFRNANLKMFLAAATAAAALSAGQAQATEISKWGDLKNFAEGDTLKVEGTGKVESTDVFDITLTGKTDSILTENAKDSANFIAKEGSISVNGTGAVLSIGSSATSGASVTLGSFKNLQGTVNLEGSGATTTTLTADTIVLGTETPVTKAAPDAIVTLKDKSVLGSESSTIKIYDGGDLQFAGADAKAIANGGIKLNGGKITVAEEKTGTIVGGVNASAGTIAIGSDSKAGTLTVESGSVSLTDTAKLESKHADTKLIVNGNLTLAAGAVTSNTGTLQIKAAQSGTSTLQFDSSDYAKVFAGKVAVSGADATSKLAINITGSDKVDLTTIMETAGTIKDAKLKKEGAGPLSITAKNASFADGEFFAATGVDVTLDTLSTGKLTGNNGAFTVKDGSLTVKDKLTVAVKDGGNSTLTVSGASAVLNLDRSGFTPAADGKAVAGGSVDAGTIKIAGQTSATDATMNVKNGTWNVNALEITKGTVNVDAANLNVNGKLTTTKDTGLLKASNASVVNAYGAGALGLGESGSITLSNSSTLVLKSSDVFEIKADALTMKADVFGTGAVTANSNSKIKFQADDAGAGVTLTETQYQILLEKTGFTGLFEGVEVTGITAKADMKLNEVKGGLSGKYDDTVVEVGAAGVAGGTYDFGAVKLKDTDTLKLADGGNLSLVNANSTTGNGNFVTKTDADGNAVAADVVLAGKTGNGLTLAGSGKIGSITLDASAPVGQSSVQFGDEKNAGAVTVAGTVGADTKELGNVVILGSDVTVQSGDVYAHNVDIQGGSLKLDDTKSFVIGKDATELASTIKGDVTADIFTVKGNSGSLLIAGDAKLELGTLTGAEGVAINIGQDGVKNGSASVVADKLVLNDGGLFIDPDYDQTKASAVVMNLSGAATNVSAGILDGKVAVGKNAAFGVGFNSLAEMDEAIGGYLTDGHFTQDTTNGGVHNALVLNKQISLDATKGGISVGETATLATTTAKTVKFGDNSALVITDNVFVDNGGVKTGTAISGADNVSFGTGSELVLVGDFNAKDDALDIFGSTVSPTGTMTVKSLNGLLEGTWNKGLLDLNLTTDQKILDSAFVDSAAPIRELLLDSKKGELGAGAGLGRDLINEVSSVSLSGAVADAAAHAATYAGAQQAAVAAVGTMAEAVGGRVGSMGVEAATIAATGSQANGGVWLSPMYKSVDADGFNAQGGSYGADVDLAGVAFGTDTVNGNMRFGAVFNIGSGDSDGKGNGNGLKDEFDYYGFGIYSVMGFGNLALVGDASLNVISHDVEGLGLKGEADTTAVTMGVTGQYTISTPMVDVTPHLGARFIRLDTDSYDLTNAEGVVATTEFEVQNVFSVPLGVTLSKAFEMGGWSLAPSADLSITFNTGDTEVDSTTRFTGINRNIGLNTEVLDEVTYGVAVGLGAQYGAFGTQIGINYTGSENTDAFGVNAKARYMF